MERRTFRDCRGKKEAGDDKDACSSDKDACSSDKDTDNHLLKIK